MNDLTAARRQLQADLGYKPLSRTWAKLEIVLGLLAVGISLSWMTHEVVHGELWVKTGRYPGLGLALFVLGGYLAMAGHRSHLYQTINEQTAYLLHQIRHYNEG